MCVCIHISYVYTQTHTHTKVLRGSILMSDVCSLLWNASEKEDRFWMGRVMGRWKDNPETHMVKCQWQRPGVEYTAVHYKNSCNFTLCLKISKIQFWKKPLMSLLILRNRILPMPLKPLCIRNMFMFTCNKIIYAYASSRTGPTDLPQSRGSALPGFLCKSCSLDFYFVKSDFEYYLHISLKICLFCYFLIASSNFGGRFWLV